MTKADVRKTLGKPQDSFKLESKVEADVWRSKNVVQVFWRVALAEAPARGGAAARHDAVGHGHVTLETPG